MSEESQFSGRTPSGLLRQARGGNVEALGFLMTRHVAQLQRQVRTQLGPMLQAKVDADDVVQEALLDAHRQFDSFRGTTESDFGSWLRQIVMGHLAKIARSFLGTRAREATLERSIHAPPEDSSAAWTHQLVNSESTPSGKLSNHEQFLLLQQILSELPADYRNVVTLRAFDGCTFAEIAERMDRTVDSVQKLWVRGVMLLRRSLPDDYLS